MENPSFYTYLYESERERFFFRSLLWIYLLDYFIWLLQHTFGKCAVPITFKYYILTYVSIREKENKCDAKSKCNRFFVTARLFTLIILSCDLSSAITDQNNLNFVNKNDFSILFLLITKNSIEFLLVKRSRFQWGFFFRRKEFNFHLISVQHFKSFSLTFAILLITLFMKGEVFLLVFFFCFIQSSIVFTSLIISLAIEWFNDLFWNIGFDEI